MTSQSLCRLSCRPSSSLLELRFEVNLLHHDPDKQDLAWDGDHLGPNDVGLCVQNSADWDQFPFILENKCSS